MVSGVVYRPFGLVELSREHMEGGDKILAQGRRNSVSLPASEVYRLVGVLNYHFMVSGVVYRLLGLVKLSREHMEGGDKILAQGRRNSVSLPASEVYRPAVYRPGVYWLIVYQPGVYRPGIYWLTIH